MTDLPSTYKTGTNSASSASLGNESLTDDTISESSTTSTINNSPLVSVIMPVYNVAPYLPTALNCLVSQTYTNLQILCIDDGSTDESAAILDQYAKQDQRITVFHTENQGVALARNLGMQHVKGKYLCFVDPDDEYALNMIAELVCNAETYHTDISICRHTYIPETTQSPVITSGLNYAQTYSNIDSYHKIQYQDNTNNIYFRDMNLDLSNKVFTSNADLRQNFTLLEKQYFVYSVWGKLLRTSFVNEFQPEFPSFVATGTDKVFMLTLYTHATCIACTSGTVCYYIPRPSSISNRDTVLFVHERLAITKQAIHTIHTWLPEHEPTFTTKHIFYFWNIFQTHYQHHKNSNLSTVCLITETLNNNDFRHMLSESSPQTLKEKMIVQAFQSRKAWYVLLLIQLAACNHSLRKTVLHITAGKGE